MAKRTIQRSCENCQKSFLAEAHQISIGKARFCSSLCANRFFRIGLTTEVVCRQCGTRFRLSISRAKQRRYCTLDCHRKSRGDFESRFWAKVDKTPGQGPQGECWQWAAGKDSGGYGLLSHNGAHRVSWEIHKGPIPDNLYVLHRCDNPPCVNPDHLFIGTQLDNVRDRIAKGRTAGFRQRAARPDDGPAS